MTEYKLPESTHMDKPSFAPSDKAHSLFQRTPLLDGSDPELKREEIRRYFHTTFDRYELLFETLSQDEAYFHKSIALRHPLIFYLGHTATFYVNKLVIAGILKQRINPGFESMFAVGVDEMSWDDLSESNYNWPSVAEVKAYRDQVRVLVDQLTAEIPLSLPINWNSPWWIILMGIEHERIHLETSSVLIRQHQLNYVRKHPAWQPCSLSGAAPQNDLLEISAGKVFLGKDKSALYYGWDNEYGHHEAAVASFQASRFLVSNGEFLTFVEAGGYENQRFWEEEGWLWKNFSHAAHPIFWIKTEHGWKLRTMLEEIIMPWDWPVEVNYHEAKAFCNWKKDLTGQSVRLPTEEEWNRLYEEAGLSEISCDMPASANIHLDHYASPCPVNAFGQSKLFDVTGNVWQWTETTMYPYEGFEVHPFYDDFTAPTFDARHNLIKGGSWISSGNETLNSARYAFRRHFFQHAGFRYVVAATPTVPATSIYETDKQLSEYAEFHYGDEYFGVPNFPKALAQLAIQSMGNKPAGRALDLGCATGRATFELARHFEQVTGIDFSARFVELGVQLAEQGRARYTKVDEGELVSYSERKLADFELAATRQKVAFFQGDACNLKPGFSGYDLIFAANLIDRLYSPTKFLVPVHERLNLGGLLLISSPCTWLPEHTRREEWLGGFKKNGENFTTLDGLTEVLSTHFNLLRGPLEVPFVIRETKRKFQHSYAEVTIWERVK
jgi:5-histidylcysteine sulfoxide synthase/putative 4-mercaptohistidine N1-methyltranferase